MAKFDTLTPEQTMKIQSALIVVGNMQALAIQLNAETLDLAAASCAHTPEFIRVVQASATFVRMVKGEMR